MVMRLPRLMFLLLVCALATELAAKPVVVQIKVGAPKIEYQTFPVGHPPMHAKGLAGEAGLCQTEIACQVGVEGEAPRISLGEARATLHTVSFTISVRITIWCQEGYTQMILDHEETHRAISEHYYAMAYKVAQRLADEAIARKLSLAGKPRAEALDRALKELQTRLLDEFMSETNQRCEFAQDRFDAITDHGRNAITNADAMAQALREEAEHWKKADPSKL